LFPAHLSLLPVTNPKLRGTQRRKLERKGIYVLKIRGLSKTFGEWYQKTNKTEDANKLTLLAFKTIAILYNTLFATFIKPGEYGEWTSFCFPA
jgi:hypothetical protein